MNKAVAISREKPDQRSMDYEALRQEGIEWLQQLSTDVWTDHNVHDPGITILEYLCFGITDLGYRFNFPITDLLYSKEKQHLSVKNNAFFAPKEILPCAPLTLNDYRKLIIDHLPAEVQNAWITPLYEQKEGYSGLYTVSIQLNQENETRLDDDQVREKVATLLSAHRNLCEDVESIVILEKMPLSVAARIDLEPDASAEQVLADVLFRIGHYLAPDLNFSDAEALMAEGQSVGEILEGPEPQHGLIRDNDLKPLLRVINVSQIRDLITETPGVVSVEQLRVKVDNRIDILEDFEIPADTYLVLSETMSDYGEFLKTNAAEGYPIHFLRSGNPVELRIELATKILKGHIAREQLDYHRSFDFSKPVPTPEKNLHDIGSYFSIQHFFPAVYGIAAYGLAGDATNLREAQARQLKGYLAFMEVLLADYLKRLIKVKHLFSIEKEDNVVQADSPETLHLPYVERLLANIADIEPLFRRDTALGRFHPDTILSKTRESARVDAERRNQFLDHLLARFAEHIDETCFTQNLADKEDDAKMLRANLDAKCRILKEYALLSRNRGLGLDYRCKKPLFRSDSQESRKRIVVSGFKKRIAYLLNIQRCEDRSLTEFFPFQQYKLEKIKPSDDPEKSAKGLPMRTLLKYGAALSNYSIREQKNEETSAWHVDFKAPGMSGDRALFQAESEAEAQRFRNRFREDIIKFNESGKGFFIVEHILLRPRLSNAMQLQVDINEVFMQQPVRIRLISLGFDEPDKVQRINDTLLVTASRSDNYEVLNDGEACFLVLMESGKPVMVSDNCGSRAEAEVLKKRMADYFLHLMKTDPGKLNRHIKQRRVPLKGFFAVPNHVYAHRLSIVLPDWPGDFMEKEFQMKVRHLVAQHVPAHLRVDFHWKSWPDMQRFESRYKTWLDALSRPEQDEKSLNDASYALVELLAPDEILHEQLPDAGETESGLSVRKIESLWKKFRYELFFSEQDLHIFERMDAQAEVWLRKNKLYNWSALAQADPEELVQRLQDSDMSNQTGNVRWWIEQARLASKKDWDHLVQLQSMLPGRRASESGKARIDRMFEQKLRSLYMV